MVIDKILEGLSNKRDNLFNDLPFSNEDVPTLDISIKEVQDEVMKFFFTKYKGISEKYGLSSVVVDLEQLYDNERQIDFVANLFYIYFNFDKLDEKDKKGVSEVLNVLSRYNKKSDIDFYNDKGKCVFIIGAEANRERGNTYKDFDKLIDFIKVMGKDFKTIKSGFELYDSRKIENDYYKDK